MTAILGDDPVLRQRITDSTLGPVPGHPLLPQQWVALAVGITGSLHGSLGVAQAAKYALNKIWAVPRHARPRGRAVC